MARPNKQDDDDGEWNKDDEPDRADPHACHRAERISVARKHSEGL